MKNFKSIDVLKNILQEHPELQSLKLKLKGYWNLAYASIYALWYILAMLCGILILSVWWFKDLIQNQLNYIDARNQEISSPVSSTLTQNIQLGPQRLFGEKVTYEGSLSTLFKLQGILYDKSPKQRMAIIQDSKNSLKFYQEGDVLPGGGLIKTIQENQVIVETSGDRHVLKLPDYPINFLSVKPLAVPGHFFKNSSH